MLVRHLSIKQNDTWLLEDMDFSSWFQINIGQNNQREIPYLCMPLCYSLHIPYIIYFWPLNDMPIKISFMILLVNREPLGVPHWQVKSSGIRQSKIFKCHECAYSNLSVNGDILTLLAFSLPMGFPLMSKIICP